MKEFVDFLNNNITGALATSFENKPYVRPWQFMFEKDGKFWFCTGNTKEVFQQLSANPYIAFTVTSPEFVTVRLSGNVTFSDSLEIKAAMIEASPLVKKIYQTADNPTLEAFYVDSGSAVMFDFSGNPPKTLTF